MKNNFKKEEYNLSPLYLLSPWVIEGFFWTRFRAVDLFSLSVFRGKTKFTGGKPSEQFVGHLVPENYWVYDFSTVPGLVPRRLSPFLQKRKETFCSASAGTIFWFPPIELKKGGSFILKLVAEIRKTWINEKCSSDFVVYISTIAFCKVLGHCYRFCSQDKRR